MSSSRSNHDTSTSCADRSPSKRRSWRSPRPTPPTGQRYVAKPYPKDNEPRTFGIRQAWLDAVVEHIATNGIGHDDLLFATKAGTPISRNTFRTRIWLPAVKASDIDVGVHDLRHAHATWLLAGGADLKSVMDRMGHSQIQTTRNTFTPSRTPTNATSTPSTASRLDSPDSRRRNKSLAQETQRGGPRSVYRWPPAPPNGRR